MVETPAGARLEPEGDTELDDEGEGIARTLLLGTAIGGVLLLMLGASFSLATRSPIYGWFYDQDCITLLEQVRVLEAGGAYRRIAVITSERVIQPVGASCRARLLDAKARALLALARTEDPLAHLAEALSAAQAAGIGDLTTLIRTQIELEQHKQQRLAELQAAEGLQAEATTRGVLVTLPEILFAPGRADLTPAAEAALSAVCRYLTSDATAPRVTVDGRTDSTGARALNRTLSRARADLVAARLLACGATRDRLVVRGLGQEHPIAPNDTPEGRAKNRRVEILIESPPPDRSNSAATVPPPTPEPRNQQARK